MVVLRAGDGPKEPQNSSYHLRRLACHFPQQGQASVPTALVICCLSPVPLRFRQRFQLEVSAELQVGLESWSPLSLVSWPQAISSQEHLFPRAPRAAHVGNKLCGASSSYLHDLDHAPLSDYIPLWCTPDPSPHISSEATSSRKPSRNSLPACIMHALLSRPPLTASAHGAVIRALHFHHRWSW